MGRRFGREKKLKLISYILMCVFLVNIIAWIEPGTIKTKISGGVRENAKNFIIHIIKESNVKVSFIFRDNSNIVEKIATNINENNNVYRFVEYHYSKEKLVAYAPDSVYADYLKQHEDTDAKTDGNEQGTEGESLLANQKDGEGTTQQENGNVGENATEGMTENQTQAETKEDPGSSSSQKGGQQVAEEPTTEVPVQETFAPAFSVEQLKDYDFLRSSLYIVPDRAKVLPEDLNAETLLGTDLSIVKDETQPQILIYHTHGSETFSDSTEDLVGTGIIAVGTKLAEELSGVYGYNVIHCTEIFDNVNGVFDRSKAYDYSRAAVLQILTDHPSIQVIIDLHRDGVREDLHLVTDVNGKQTAQIMFFNGVSRSSAKGDLAYLYNRYRGENLAFSLQAKLEALGKYPDFTRKNYIDAYQYNLDLLPRAMLIESGAQTNTLQEELNAMEPLADILDSVLSGKNREHLY